MTTQESTRAARGTVAIEDKQGKWRIRLPRSVAQDSQRYISTRLDATTEHFKRVQVVAWQIEEDIRTGSLDTTLERYSSAFRPQLTIVRSAKALDLAELWDKYCDYRKPQVAVTTFKREYLLKFKNHIKEFPTKDLNQAMVIRDHLLSKTSAGTTKRILTRLSACCHWATKSGLIKSNPFFGMAAEVQLPKNEAEQIDPFTAQERETILKAFQDHPKHCHYYSFVRFLFLTGCRTGEAIALQWKHISKDCTQITFSDSYDHHLKIRKCTKTGKIRKFPCNKTLQSLLLTIRPSLADPEELVFKSPTGLTINNSKFTNQVWKGCRSGKKTYHGLVTGLVAAGLVDRYRCLYTTRHTFITMALEGGVTVPQVAKLVGNSPEVILRHYAGGTLKFEVPVM